MAAAPKVVLKATEQVLNDIQSFTDTEIVSDLLDLFEFRLYEEHGLLTEKEMFAGYDHEADFIYWELNTYPELKGKLACDYEEMKQELNFLYYAASVGYYKDVELLLMEYVGLLEKKYGSEEAILAELTKKSKTQTLISYKGGQKRTTELPTKNSSSLLSRLEMYNKISYASFMFGIISEFKKNITPFITDKELKHRLKTVTTASTDSLKLNRAQVERILPHETGYNDTAEERLRKLFADTKKYDGFINLCKDYSKPLIGKNRRDEITEKSGNRFEWLGITIKQRKVVVDSLGHFIHELLDKDYLKKGNDKREIARAFIPFFFEKKKSVKSLADQIKSHKRIAPYLTIK